MAITPNDRETIAAVDSMSGQSFYVEGTSATGAINVNIAGSAVTFDGNITEIGGAPISLGQKTMANSLPIVIASDQTALPVSQSGTWNINNISGTISLPTGAATSALQTTGNTSLSTIASNQTNNSQVTQLVDALGNAVTVTGNKLDVNATVTGGTGSAQNDNTAFTAGSTSMTVGGGFYHSTIDTVTDGRAAAVAITPKRGQHVNLRDSSGNETGVAALPLQVSLANTAANATAVKVDGTGGSFPISGTVAVTQSTSPWVVTGSGTAGSAAAGVQTIQGIASMTPVQVSQATASNLNATVVQGTASNLNATVVQGTATNLKTQAENYQGGSAVSSSNPLEVNLRSATAGINVSSNLAQVNGATVNVGTGAAGTGTQRVTTSTDSTIGTVTTVTTLTGTTTLTPGTGATNLGKAEDAGHTTGDVGVMDLAVRQDVQSALAGTTLDYIPKTTDSVGSQYMTLSASTGAIGASMYFNSGLTSTKQAVNANGGNLYGYHLYNPNSSVAYIQFFNLASASVTVGSTTPNMVVAIPAFGWADSPTTGPGIGFATAMTVAATTTSTGSGNPTSAILTNIWYK